MAQNVQRQLMELGSKLESPPSSKDVLLKLLNQAATILSDLEQSLSASILDSMQPFLKDIVKPELLKHQDKDVKLLVACCLCEITRITAPEAPYSDEILKDIFGLIVGTFNGLNDLSGPSFGRRVLMLETLARYRSCVVMLDLECDELVNEVFRAFIAISRDEHPDNVLTSMKTIMIDLLEESEDIHEDVVVTLLSTMTQDKKDITKAAKKLAMSVVEHSSEKLEPAIKQLLISSMSGDDRSANCQINYHEVIFYLYQCSPQILSGIVPYLTEKLLTDQSETRLWVVKLVGELFAIPAQAIYEAFQPIFAEFLRRLTDRVVEVRMLVLEYIRSCLLSNPSRSETPQIYAALCNRLMDCDENVREQVVAVLCDVACHDLNSLPVETLKLVAERLCDKSLLVKKYTMDRLAEIYRLSCSRCTEGFAYEYDWIPGKIIRCFYDKDFRSDAVEWMLSETLFPSDFTIKDRVIRWIKTFPGLDKGEVKALEKILEHKQRLQQEMQKYLSFKQTYEDVDVTDFQKKAILLFRVMSRCFTDPAKAEEGFQNLDQLKDANIWRILLNLLDPNLNASLARHLRDDMLKILGEKHQLFGFLSILSIKCSFMLFNKEHVKEILLKVVTGKSAADSQHNLSCMNMLVILARYNPDLFSGSEEELLKLLKEEDDVIKEGILHVLAIAGGTIHEQLASSSISVDLTLERLCLQGSRRQAKYAVHALAAITKDGSLLSLSVLYKRLVDLLEDKTHLPSVLQSLGCIAQTAMAVFETREGKIVEFIRNKILQCSNKTQGKKKTRWLDRSELCLLKIFGIKLLVKSYLPVKDAHLRAGIDNIIEILRNFLLFGEVSKEVESSLVDKAHLRLASAKAILRLSRYWDHKIPADVFHLTLRAVEISFPQARKIFRSKVHQYVKDRVLDAKYACVFLLSTLGSRQAEIEEDKRNLADIIQMCCQARVPQLSVQSETHSPMPYPEYILPYLIHALAHHRLCPNVDECKDPRAFAPIYRILYFFLSVVVNGAEDVRPEVNATDKESVLTLTSILRHIKHSEDVVDVTKSKNSYAICDLGLTIIKHVTHQLDPPQNSAPSVILPPTIYKQRKIEDDNSAETGEVRTWLADDSVLAHFDTLKLAVNGTVPPVIAEDEIMEDSEIDRNDMPLGKLIKHMKTQKVKAGKGVGENSSPAEMKNPDDLDVLKVVREINLDGLGISTKFDSSNGLDILARDDEESGKKKWTDSSSVPIPKRHRSSSAKSRFKNPVPRTVKGAASISVKRLSMKEVKEPRETELLVSCIQKKHRGSGFGQSNDEGPRSKEADASEKRKLDCLTEKKTDDSVKSPDGSMKKRKRRSIAGLSKCSSKEGETHTTDLVDCRIKVWWPLDKKFYDGVVKSYDPEKKKHVVLYDDGDVEVLRLAKERWRLIHEDGKLNKKSKTLKSFHKGVSSDKKTKLSDGSSRKTSDERSSTPKRKRTPKKDMKHKGKDIPGQKTTSASLEAEQGPATSDPEPTLTSEVDELNLTDPKSEKADGEDKSPWLKYEEKSGLGQAGAGEESCDDDDSNEKQESSLKGHKDRSTESSHEDCDVGKSDPEEKKQAGKPSPEPFGDQMKEVEQPDGAHDISAEQNKSDSSESTDAEEDKPIGAWKRRVEKLSRGR